MEVQNIHKVLGLFYSIQDILNAKYGEADADTKTFVLMIPRLCGITKLNRQSTSEEFEIAAKKIYDAFGAPGDWGYETPLGNTLRKIYEWTEKGFWI